MNSGRMNSESAPSRMSRNRKFNSLYMFAYDQSSVLIAVFILLVFSLVLCEAAHLASAVAIGAVAAVVILLIILISSAFRYRPHPVKAKRTPPARRRKTYVKHSNISPEMSVQDSESQQHFEETSVVLPPRSAQHVDSSYNSTIGSLNEACARQRSRTVLETMRSMNHKSASSAARCRAGGTFMGGTSPSTLFERPKLEFSKSVDKEVEAFSERLMKSQTCSPDQKLKITLPKGALEKMKVISIGHRRNSKEGGLSKILSSSKPPSSNRK